MSGRGQPTKREGTNLGDVQEDCSPHSTQSMRNCGRDLHARDNLLRVTTLGVCPPDTQSFKTIMKASLPAGPLSPSPFFEFELVSMFLTYHTPK